MRAWIVAVVLSATTPACGGDSTPARNDLPRSMAALGDSMTRAFLVCDGGDCPAASWASGTDDDVRSHRQRLARARGDEVTAHNLAVSGATVSGLAAQVSRAVELRPEYVTILIGANDACAPREQAMTPLAEFASAFEAALDALVAGLPRARVFVASIPDLHRLWEVGHDRADVRAVWQRLGSCQSMLADAAATDAATVARRARVRAKVAAYNAALAAACARHPTCHWDGNAVYEFAFALADVSDRDYWHPSRRGQATLAEVTWDAGPWGP